MDLVKLRNAMKKKKPYFVKQMARQRKGLKNKWRKPRGSDSKIKIGKKDYPKKIKIGFKGPRKVRGLSRDGFNIVLVKNISDVMKVDKEKDIICLSNIGNKKKIEIVKKCVELNLKFLNLKNPSAFLKKFEEDFQKRKEEKKKKYEEKTKKSVEKKNKKKEGIEAKVDDEEKESKEKKEKDKLLTKREI